MPSFSRDSPTNKFNTAVFFRNRLQYAADILDIEILFDDSAREKPSFCFFVFVVNGRFGLVFRPKPFAENETEFKFENDFRIDLFSYFVFKKL